MLIVLTATAWIALMLFGVVVCKMAALGDRARSNADTADPGRIVHSGLVVWDEASEAAAKDERRVAPPRRRHRHITLHGLR